VSFGIPISEIITVYGPQALAATAIVSKSSTTDISNDGEITITNVIGGVSPYTYTLLDYANTWSYYRGTFTIKYSKIIQNLEVRPINGYTVMVTDNVGTKHFISGLIVTGLPIWCNICSS
jgi:hypothetical protein